MRDRDAEKEHEEEGEEGEKETEDEDQEKDQELEHAGITWHPNTAQAGDNWGMAQASTDPGFKRDPPGTNNPEGRPKHEIVRRGDPPPLALRNGLTTNGGAQPGTLTTPENLEDEAEIPPEEYQVGFKEYLGVPTWCMECAYEHCLCTLLKVDLKLKTLKTHKMIKELIIEEINKIEKMNLNFRNGGGPLRGSFFSKTRPFLYPYRKGTHQ